MEEEEAGGRESLRQPLISAQWEGHSLPRFPRAAAGKGDQPPPPPPPPQQESVIFPTGWLEMLARSCQACPRRGLPPSTPTGMTAYPHPWLPALQFQVREEPWNCGHNLTQAPWTQPAPLSNGELWGYQRGGALEASRQCPHLSCRLIFSAELIFGSRSRPGLYQPWPDDPITAP